MTALISLVISIEKSGWESLEISDCAYCFANTENCALHIHVLVLTLNVGLLAGLIIIFFINVLNLFQLEIKTSE